MAESTAACKSPLFQSACGKGIDRLSTAVAVGAWHERKDAGETVAQATGPVSRLQFTAEERASPELAPYIKKAEKRADKLEAAKEALPKKRVVTKETVYDRPDCGGRHGGGQ